MPLLKLNVVQNFRAQIVPCSTGYMSSTLVLLNVDICKV